MKTCSKCKEWKADYEFYDHHKSWCKSCHIANNSARAAVLREADKCIVNASIDVNKAYFEAVMKKRRAEHES